MQLYYHRKSLEMISHEPVFATAPPNLPPSVAEWYSLVNAVELLEKYSNQDDPLPPAEFRLCRYKDTELVVFLYENQGVVWWAFENCEKDDPPVYINIDPPPDNWLLCCENFSSFVYTRFFDFLHWYDKKLSILGFGNPLEVNIIDQLHREYFPEPVTYGWPGDTQLRFSNADQRISIQYDDQVSNWHFSANTPDNLQKVFEKFKPLLYGCLPPLKDT
ncbi:MAG: hypothetical protein CVU39_18740 [Chloroflexi bacterium HGW-Chloroflexi-10]|nr:MAG: hypothetical protein CVU39_18740 [Chloroflexi bacterium HGW-Chloroflexi-10]